MSTQETEPPRIRTRFAAGVTARVVAIVLGVIGLSIGVLATAPPAGATAARAQTFNMCQDLCHRPNTQAYRTASPHDKVRWFIGTAPAPVWFVGLTEACAPAIAYIAFHLPPTIDYRTHFYPDDGGARPQTAPCSNGQFGNASVEYGSTLGTNTVALANSDDMHCATKQGFGFAWRGCVVHLVSGDAAGARADLRAIRSWWDGHPGMIFLAGDLNLRPGDLDDIFPTEWDVDPVQHFTALMSPTSPSVNRRIDYVFGRPSFFGAGRAGNVDCDPKFSDHCYVFGAHHR